MTCPSCGADTPEGRFCVRCGYELAAGRRGYGPSPGERAGLPHLVSTLFPALPRASMRSFRIVLAGGAALTAGLALGGLFPLALAAAALLIPILTALYLWDVDVYEDQPWRVVGLTLALGAAGGVALGLLSESVLPGLGGADHELVVGGVVLPLAALTLALAGPVALLLPRARFNDALDGATFGAVGAAALGAALTLTRGASLLAGGLRPEGDTSAWLLRLAGLGVGMPVLAMCATGGVTAALWIRFRAPVGDRSALGPLSRPAVALPAAALLLVAGALAQLLLPGGAWLAVLAVLDGAGLLWLRRSVQVGLRQQAGEHEPGAPAVCGECGVATPLHAYCGSCGTARAALPKREQRRRRTVVAVAGLALLGGVGAAAAGAAVSAPSSLAPPCLRGVACGSPPGPPAPLVAEREVAGDRLGWTGAYDPGLFALTGSGDDGYDLAAREDTGAAMTVRVRVREGTDVDGALDAERDHVAEDALGLTPVTDPELRIAGPMVGYRTAQVRLLTGVTDSPQGPGDGVTAAILGATDGRLTTTVTLRSTGRNDERRRAVLGLGDVVLQGFRWGAAGDVTAALVLRPRDRAGLLAAAESAGRGRQAPLTAAQIGARFGATPAALARVRAAVRAAGLRPGAVLPQRLTMRVHGPVAAVQRAFGVRLLAARGGRHRPDRAARVPAALRRDVRAVSGLDTRATARPAAFPAGGLRPVDARRAYGMPARVAGRAPGTGETIAVLSLDSFRDSDIVAYDRLAGVDSGPVERVPVGGGTRLGPGAEEVSLDLEVLRGLAPGATLLNYETPNVASAFGDAVERIVADGRARVVSVSWGRCELTLPAAERAHDEAAFAVAAAAGVSIFVASGDSGAYECERFDPGDQRLSVSWPAASRHVVAVGGTTLRLGPDRRRRSESGWESPLSNAGAGGGVAAREPQPTWQRDGAVPGLRNRFSTGRRQVPDVAAAADFRSGWLTVVDGEARALGGTSAAAPFWAAVAATVRQALRARRLPVPRSFAPFLYALAAAPGSRAFHDITDGGNRFHDATPGWDYATGLGTPDVGALTQDAVARQRDTP